MCSSDLSLINGRTGAGTAGQGLKVEWDSTNDGELHWMDVDESSLEAGPPWYGGRGVFAGQSNSITTIEYITIASPGNYTDFGDLTVGRGNFDGCSNGSRGVFGGGYNTNDTGYNTIDYITISTPGNATDFGDITVARDQGASFSDGTYGVYGGGEVAAPSNIIEYVTIATLGNGTDFGDLSSGRNGAAGLSGD